MADDESLFLEFARAALEKQIEDGAKARASFEAAVLEERTAAREERQHRLEVWDRILDRVERVVDRMLTTSEKRSQLAGAAKQVAGEQAIVPDDEGNVDFPALLRRLAQRPPVEQAVKLLLDAGAEPHTLAALLDDARKSDPWWRQFLDADAAWLDGVTSGVAAARATTTTSDEPPAGEVVQ